MHIRYEYIRKHEGVIIRGIIQPRYYDDVTNSATIASLTPLL